jgi:hypothetical protein
MTRQGTFLAATFFTAFAVASAYLIRNRADLWSAGHLATGGAAQSIPDAPPAFGAPTVEGADVTGPTARAEAERNQTLGADALKRGDLKLRLSYFDEALRLWPDYPDALFGRLKANLAAQKYQAVVADCDLPMRASPAKAACAWFARGTTETCLRVGSLARMAGSIEDSAARLIRASSRPGVPSAACLTSSAVAQVGGIP